MAKEVKKEIIKRVFSILYTLTFLIVSTWFWFGPREEIVKAKAKEYNYTYASVIDFNELTKPIDVNHEVISDESEMNNKSYDFTIRNNSSKEIKYLLFFVPDSNKITRDGCEILPNNYIKYRIKKNDQEYSEVRSLSLDGRIYVDNLASSELAKYSIQYWISEDVQESVKKRHFHSKIAIANDNNS